MTSWLLWLWRHWGLETNTSWYLARVESQFPSIVDCKVSKLLFFGYMMSFASFDVLCSVQPGSFFFADWHLPPTVFVPSGTYPQRFLCRVSPTPTSFCAEWHLPRKVFVPSGTYPPQDFVPSGTYPERCLCRVAAATLHKRFWGSSAPVVFSSLCRLSKFCAGLQLEAFTKVRKLRPWKKGFWSPIRVTKMTFKRDMVFVLADIVIKHKPVSTAQDPQLWGSQNPDKQNS